MARAVMDLPEPDSPTRPSDSPACRVKETSRSTGRIFTADRQPHDRPADVEQGLGHARSNRRSPSRFTAMTTSTIAMPALSAASG